MREEGIASAGLGRRQLPYGAEVVEGAVPGYGSIVLSKVAKGFPLRLGYSAAGGNAAAVVGCRYPLQE